MICGGFPFLVRKLDLKEFRDFVETAHPGKSFEETYHALGKPLTDAHTHTRVTRFTPEILLRL